jgi:hypothetical protein
MTRTRKGYKRKPPSPERPVTRLAAMQREGTVEENWFWSFKWCSPLEGARRSREGMSVSSPELLIRDGFAQGSPFEIWQVSKREPV